MAESHRLILSITLRADWHASRFMFLLTFYARLRKRNMYSSKFLLLTPILH